jgi:hypothetical protein
MGGRWLQARWLGPSPHGIGELAIKVLIAEGDSDSGGSLAIGPAVLLDRLDQSSTPVVFAPGRPGGKADGEQRNDREENQNWGW